MSTALEENSHNEAVLELNLFLTVCAVPHLDHTCSDTCYGTSGKMGLNLNLRVESAALKKTPTKTKKALQILMRVFHNNNTKKTQKKQK